MKRSILSKTATAVLAIGTFGAAAAANAATSVYLSVGAPVVTRAPVYVAPPAHVQPHPAHQAHPRTVNHRSRPVYDVAPAYGHEWGYGQQRSWRSACRAPRWNPDVRYMPGQAVWRHGTLYLATRLSASVWNVNSPPEWTPTYWVPARCA
jgi:hypothetical protein